MAVDTKDKRFSMLNFGDGSTIQILPDPNAAIGSADRQHLLDCYSGIAFAGAPEPAEGVPAIKTAIALSIGMGR